MHKSTSGAPAPSGSAAARRPPGPQTATGRARAAAPPRPRLRAAAASRLAARRCSPLQIRLNSPSGLCQGDPCARHRRQARPVCSARRIPAVCVGMLATGCALEGRSAAVTPVHSTCSPRNCVSEQDSVVTQASPLQPDWKLTVSVQCAAQALGCSPGRFLVEAKPGRGAHPSRPPAAPPRPGQASPRCRRRPLPLCGPPPPQLADPPSCGPAMQSLVSAVSAGRLQCRLGARGPEVHVPERRTGRALALARRRGWPRRVCRRPQRAGTRAP